MKKNPENFIRKNLWFSILNIRYSEKCRNWIQRKMLRWKVANGKLIQAMHVKWTENKIRLRIPPYHTSYSLSNIVDGACFFTWTHQKHQYESKFISFSPPSMAFTSFPQHNSIGNTWRCSDIFAQAQWLSVYCKTIACICVYFNQPP